ncbi:MAG: DUF6754 domain-containing protein [Anaerolineaceae bacterium]
MTSLPLSDLIALVIVFLAAMALLVNLILQRKQNDPELKSVPAVTAISAFQHEAAENGKRLTFGLGDGFSTRSVSLNSLVSLSAWRDTAARAVFNDQPSQSVSGDGALTMISQMVQRGVYQDAVAVELFKPEQILLGGVTDAANVAGLLPEVTHSANSAVVLIGSFTPLAGLAVNLAGRKQLPIVAVSDTLTAQATFFVTTSLSSLGEDYYASEVSRPRQSNASVQWRAQDWLRIAAIVALLMGALFKLTGVMP